jgi:cytoskeleton protein RodZ
VRLFQRIKTPFGKEADEYAFEPERQPPPVGELLRERREELGLDLDAVGAALRIKPTYLAALEHGRAQDLPGPTYAIGFIRAYAHYLGFDAGQILAGFKAESAEVRVRPDLSLPAPLGERGVPGGPILLAALLLALCGYGAWYYLSAAERSRPERVAAVPAELQHTAPAIRTPAAAPIIPHLLPGNAPLSPTTAVAIQPPPSAAPTATALPLAGRVAVAKTADTVPAAVEKAAPAPAEAAAAGPSGHIDIRAIADCWIRVSAAADQSIVVFSRVLKAGETYHVPRAGLVMRTGNAGALAVVVDGKPAPALGAIGALRRNVALDPQALLAGTAVHG